MEDTIAAIATPVGEGGIGIIRISGEWALSILQKIFKPATGGDIKSRQMTYGHIVDPETGAVLDEVLAVYMKGPKTYTAEDVVEINCHGGVVPLRRVLDLVLSTGAVPAEPGEFTKRAFLNGRLDLSQAEAVIDVIKAKTDKSFDVAMDQLQGGFSGKINEIKAKMVDVLVKIDVNIDYSDEDIEIFDYEQLSEALESITSDLELLLKGSERGKILRDGLSVAIIGKPNVGKSSLMNNLLRESRAIVTEIPGTTRDTIEEFVNIKGIPVKLTDTAGIRETEDLIEQIGIEKSKESFNNADLVIFIVDCSRELDDEDRQILGKINRDKTLFVFNKFDKDVVLTEEDIQKIGEGSRYLKTSMKNLEDTFRIEEAIYDMFFEGDASIDNRDIVTNARHVASLKEAKTLLVSALEAVKAGEPMELVEIDVNTAYEELGFITGDTVRDDIIDEVFSRFCLGK